MNDLIEKLREAAMKANGDEWKSEEVRTASGRAFRIGTGEMLSAGKGCCIIYDDFPGRPDNERSANAAHIALASPANVLNLIERCNMFKGKDAAKSKLLEKFRADLREIIAGIEDEGDRAYFGSTNDADLLKEFAHDMDGWHWDKIIGQNTSDPYAAIRALRKENAALLDRLQRAEEATQWRTMESAPKDGREILLWISEPWGKVEKARWYEPWANWQSGTIPYDPAREEYCGIGWSLPTHWMPLPPTPPLTRTEGE